MLDSTDTFVADALRLLQDRGTQVLNAIDDGVFLLDHMLGFTNREVLGKPTSSGQRAVKSFRSITPR